jgi:hypothetical protein
MFVVSYVCLLFLMLFVVSHVVCLSMLLFVICSFIICHLFIRCLYLFVCFIVVICHLSFIISHLLFVICYFSLTSSQLPSHTSASHFISHQRTLVFSTTFLFYTFDCLSQIFFNLFYNRFLQLCWQAFKSMWTIFYKYWPKQTNQWW